MPIYGVQDGAGPVPQVPAHLTRMPISLISVTMDCTGRTVKGKVVHKGPLVSLEDDYFLLKTVIQDDDPQQSSSPEPTSINVILLGALAKDFSKSVNQGDLVEATGFTVGKSPTAVKDRLHPCNIQLSGDDACLYVSRSTAIDPKASVATKRRAPHAAEVKAPKYTYISLGDLKLGAVVNVYAVVVFFKQPFKTRGTDYCSTLKLTDQSNEKVACQIFFDKLDRHPTIFKIGDIIRLHRVKVQMYNGSTSLVTTHGFSAVTFDGAVGSAIVPRATSQTFHFGQEDQKAVAELRLWAAGQSLLPSQPGLPLSAVQPTAYFDLTCQLLAKAPVDSSCVMLKVWDGTKCAYPLLNVMVEASAIEGFSTLSRDQQNLTAGILVYDNHVEVARNLKPGAYLKIHNIHARPGASRVPATAAAGLADEENRLELHLHGGTSYGRGIQVLPADCPDVQELKKKFENFSHLDRDDRNDSEIEEAWATPPESFDTAPTRSITERTCSHAVEQQTLAEVKQAATPGSFHVHAQLKSHRPRRLYQSLKLYCPKCQTIKDVPDDESVDGVFTEALKDAGPCNDSWAVSAKLELFQSTRSLTLYMPKNIIYVSKDPVFLMGSTLEETHRLSQRFDNIIPVRSVQGSMALLDLTAPFLFQGPKQFYGCKQCSEVRITGSFDTTSAVMDGKTVAEALGVQLLEYGLLMKLELQDPTDTLDVFLWRNAESFFRVSPDDVAANQEAQDRIGQTMDKLCPAGSSMAERPWLDLCLHAYNVEDNGQNLTCYQICHTTSTIPFP